MDFKGNVNMGQQGKGSTSETSPLVSIIIPAFNAAGYIGDAIESALDQSYPIIEIIIVDDGSTDETRVKVGQYKDKIKYIYQDNRGVSAARNMGIRNAKGEYIAFLDSDDIWLPKKLEKQLQCFSDHSKVGLVFGDSELFNQSGTTVRSFLKERKIASLLKDGEIVIHSAFERLLDENFIPTSTVILKRDLVEGINGFDESLKSVEDRDLWLRVAWNVPIACVPEVLSRKRSHGENISSDRVEAYVSQIRVLEKVMNHPVMSEGLDQDWIRNRLAELNFDLGYSYFNRGEYPAARKSFRRSFLGKYWLKAIIYWLSTFLGSRLVGRVRRIKQERI